MKKNREMEDIVCPEPLEFPNRNGSFCWGFRTLTLGFGFFRIAIGETELDGCNINLSIP